MDDTYTYAGSMVQGPRSKKHRELKALEVTTTVEHERKENGWYIYLYIYVYIVIVIVITTYHAVYWSYRVSRTDKWFMPRSIPWVPGLRGWPTA